MARKEVGKTRVSSKHTDLDRKSRIVEAALALFKKHGAAFTKLNEVAKAANVPAPLIHYYFKDIESLHFEVTKLVLEELKEFNIGEASKHSGNPDRMMQEYLKGPLLWASKRPESLSIWLYFYYQASRSPIFNQLNTEIRKVGRDRIALMIYQGIEKKLFKIQEGMTVPDVAFHIQSLLTGYTFMYATEEQSESITFFQNAILNQVSILLGHTL